MQTQFRIASDEGARQEPEHAFAVPATFRAFHTARRLQTVRNLPLGSKDVEDFFRACKMSCKYII